MILPLSYYGQPVLRKPAEPVTIFDDNLRKLADDMIDTMHAESGIGLAGPQIGQSLRIFVMEIPPDMDQDDEGNRANPFLNGPLVVINPQIRNLAPKTEVMEEGCLSIPDIRGNVSRPLSLTLDYQDLDGKPLTLNLSFLAARCALHENDHLDGVLFLDHLSQVKRLAIKGKLRKLKEQYSA
ncbi:MAG: peptide deformylase [Verrucomicrobia bacterium]|nr:peptide deformylase [Verrucomicrobiota bacterium]MCH8525771.1 peptide deformylase [Kiritimatiellia bacterium]